MATPTTIEWDALEYEHRPRGTDWYWALGIIAIATALASILFGNHLLALIIIVAAFTLMLLSARKPEYVRVVINDRGVRIKNEFFPYRNLRSFWLDEELDEPVLILHAERLIFPHIHLTLNGMDAREVQYVIAHYLKEVYEEPSVTDAIARFFGF